MANPALKNRLLDACNLPLLELLSTAFAVRSSQSPPVLTVSAPGIKRFDNGLYKNNPSAFRAISITGTDCLLKCEHCKGILLKHMISCLSKHDLVETAVKLKNEGCRGVLITGGCDKRGRVPFEEFIDAFAQLKNMGLIVIIHSGLLTGKVARKLKNTGIDQVLVDVIGSAETIKTVCHLAKKPADYYKTMDYIMGAGLEVYPHIVIGLHYGKLLGELNAISQIFTRGINDIIFVIMNPLPGTAMAKVRSPQVNRVARLIAASRIVNPEANLVLGCARPGGATGLFIERYALKAGINGIAFPSLETLTLAKVNGLDIEYQDLCCSLGRKKIVEYVF